MKKNGFIATSLIYSFFLVFCAVLLSFITISTHNKNLLDKANEDIRNDLITKKLLNIPIGSFVKLDVSHPDFNTNVNWILFDTGTNALLVSDANVVSYKADNAEAMASRLVTTLVEEFSNSCFIENARILDYNDFALFNDNANEKYIIDRLMNISPKYYVKNANKLYTFPTITDDSMTVDEYKATVFRLSNYETHVPGTEVNFRVVITLDKNDLISGGNGSKNNPYRISC